MSTRRSAAISLVSLLACVSLVRAEEPPTFLVGWGAFGTGNGQFDRPSGLATDAAGNIYVSDQRNGRIQKFTSTGTFLTKWGSIGSGNGEFANPWTVAIGPAGDVYVTDTENHRIQKFSNTGTYLGQWGSLGSEDGQFNFPYGVATDSVGNVYVSEYGNSRIQKFTSTGEFLTKWGSSGSGDGQFSNPLGVIVDRSGNVFVTDAFNDNIQKFTSTGTFLTKWGSRGSGDGQFHSPRGVAVDAAGNVYVADWFNYRVQKFSGTGTYLTKWRTNAPGQFGDIWGVAVDGSNVYITDVFRNRIEKFGNCPVRNEVVSFQPGPGTNLNDAWQSVGERDGRGTPLGYRGRLVLRFPNGVADGPGEDLRVYELGHTGPPAIDENHRVEASADGITYAFLGDSPGDVATFDLAVAGLSVAHYIRITDLPPMEQSTSDYTVIGADIDAVIVLHCLRNEADCDNGGDDDGDGLADCADGDCRADADGDGALAPPCGTDCNDVSALVHVGRTEMCGNGVDDDCDGLIDCGDGGCSWHARAQPLDCDDPCNAQSDFCSSFEWIGGAPANPLVNFDVVLGADTRMGADFTLSDLRLDAQRILSEFESLPAAPSYASRVSWWIYKSALPVPRTKAEIEAGMDPAFSELLSKHDRYGFEYSTFRTTMGTHPVGATLHLGRYVWSVYGFDPSVDQSVEALHELGHAFGLKDEYPGNRNSCSGCRTGLPFRSGLPVPNVFLTQSDCASAIAFYATCGVDGTAFDFCDPGGSWRVGDGQHNINLMRAKSSCTPWSLANGYGQLGDIRIRQVVERVVTPCFSPYSVAESRAQKMDSVATSVRQCVVRIRLVDGEAMEAVAAVEPDSGITTIPGGDPLFLQLLDQGGDVLEELAIRDPAVYDIEGEISVDSSDHVVEYRIRHPDGARAWHVVEADGTIRVAGSLETAFHKYCRAINFTDSVCWAAEGPAAVPPVSATTAVRLKAIWPNPARGSVFLRLETSREDHVSVKIFDIAGRDLRTLRRGELEPGIHTMEWDTRDDLGRSLSPGVYFCAVTVGAERVQRTIIVIR